MRAARMGGHSRRKTVLSALVRFAPLPLLFASLTGREAAGGPLGPRPRFPICSGAIIGNLFARPLRRQQAWRSRPPD